MTAGLQDDQVTECQRTMFLIVPLPVSVFWEPDDVIYCGLFQTL